jgi:hypothetical protein
MTEYQLLSEFGMLSNTWFLRSQKTIYFINKLESAFKTYYNKPFYTFKTSRHVIYANGETSYDLKLGKKYPLSVFNSTTIRRDLEGLISFASFETGTSCFTILIPPGTRFAYIGINQSRSRYANEYELLLPPGGSFVVKDIKKESYVGLRIPTKLHYIQLKHYIVEYIQPKIPYSRRLLNKLPAPSKRKLYTIKAPLGGHYHFKTTFPKTGLTTKPQKKKTKVTPQIKEVSSTPAQTSMLNGNLATWVKSAVMMHFPNVLKQWSNVGTNELFKEVREWAFKFLGSLKKFVPLSANYWQDTLKPALKYALSQFSTILSNIFVALISSIWTAIVNASAKTLDYIFSFEA